MTPERFRECLKSIGWTQHGLAAVLGVHETRPRRWATGRYEIPPAVAEWLETLTKVHDLHPYPKDWDTRRWQQGRHDP